jgi:hypothetical protein
MQLKNSFGNETGISFSNLNTKPDLGSVHNSSRGNLLAQKRACRVENARKVSNLAVLFALQARLSALLRSKSYARMNCEQTLARSVFQFTPPKGVDILSN